jgi:AraC family transcriptional regulator
MCEPSQGRARREGIMGAPAGNREFRGLDQFDRSGAAAGVSFCIAGARPYALDFNNGDDVICLLLGDIRSVSRFDADAPGDLRFVGETSAFHPAHGRVQVDAHEVRRGFVAFGYPSRYLDRVEDRRLDPIRRSGSQNNIAGDNIRLLARYARQRLASGEPMSELEIESLAALVYVETLRFLGDGTEPRHGLSDEQFNRIDEFILRELDTHITCARMAEAVDLPLRVVVDGIKQRTGLTAYRYVIERRMDRARHLLQSTSLPISEVALSCGFSSQQHLTATLSRNLGLTPKRARDRH